MNLIQVDGREVAAVSARDRGLQFGDGVFETMALVDGRIRLLDRHLQRLDQGLSRLRIEFDAWEATRRELQTLACRHGHGVIKLLVTRGSGSRGYAAPQHPRARRVVYLHPWPALPEALVLHVCVTRLACGGSLAGIKHLNRLEQILARLEVDSVAEANDGLMLDTESRVIETTNANLFVAVKGRILTPSLQRCGVAGVMRACLIEQLQQAGQRVEVTDLQLQDLDAAEEIFATNSVAVITPVTGLQGKRWEQGPVTRRAGALLHDYLAGQGRG